MNSVLKKDPFEKTLKGHVEMYEKTKNPRRRLINWGYAISIGDLKGIRGLVGAFEFARRYKDEILDYPEMEYKPSPLEIEDLISGIQSGIDFNQNFIAVLHSLQKYYNDNYGNLRIIFYFSKKTNNNRVLYRGKRIPKAYNLCVYKDPEENYYVIKNVRKFFFGGSIPFSHYCYDCNSLYKPNFTTGHRKDCPAKCKGCLRMDVDCEGNFDLRCDHCFRKFANQECFAYHIENGLCGTPGIIQEGKHWNCPICAQEVLFDAFRKMNPEHYCYEKRCFKCYMFHDPLAACLVPLKKRKLV
jgi:hypothetical protein